MVREIRKFWKQIKSKQTVMGAMIIGLMIAISAFSFVTLVPETVQAYEPEYDPQASGDFTYHKQITISPTYVDATLTGFPILIHDNTGDLLGKVLSNASDIAFYAVGNVTQYSHEIDEYNSTTGELWAWVNITSVSSSVNTILYMYYGDADGGRTIGHNPTLVWDQNFTGVFHMNESSGVCYDSSLYSNHGTFNNDLPNQTAGKIGYGQYFDSSSDDNISLPAGCFVTTANTFECWYDSYGPDQIDCLYQQYTDTANRVWFYLYTGAAQYDWALYVGSVFQFDINVGNRNTSWEKVAAGYESGWGGFRINTTLVGSDTSVTPSSIWTFTSITLGATNVGGAHFEGIMDEVRISNINRSTAWLDTSFHTQNETSGFLTLGAQQGEGETSTFQIKGLQDNRITWSGTAGTTVYCNSTGDYNEWLEINMSINASDNVTEIRVFMDDINVSTGLTEWVNASNITMYVSNSTNETYHSFGTFSDGGSNISINSTTWNTYIGAYNPFNDSGLNDINTSLYLIFKISIPSAATTNIFYTLTATANKIYLGHYT